MSRTRYASRTQVSESRSEVELRQLLTSWQASEVIMSWRETQFIIGFVLNGIGIRFILPMPSIDDAEVQLTDTGKRRSQAQAEIALGTARRQRLRAILLVIKAKLNAVELGIETIEEAFLSNVMTNDGQTVGDMVLPQIRSGSVGRLMLPQSH